MKKMLREKCRSLYDCRSVLHISILMLCLLLQPLLGWSQQKKITININKAPLEQAIEQIEQQSDYYFLYNSSLISPKTSVSVNKTNAGISEVLDQMFNNTGISYTLVDQQVVLSLTAANQTQTAATGTGNTANNTSTANSGTPSQSNSPKEGVQQAREVSVRGPNTSIMQTGVTRIVGVVLEANKASTPVDFATVILLPSGAYSITNTKGEFVFEKVDAGRATIRIELMGMVPIDTTVVLVQGAVNRFAFRMQQESFRLKEVTVTATHNKAGQSTSSNISRAALDHLQTNSLAGVLQLLPGGTTKNPSIIGPSYFNIRSISSETGAAGMMNSLGTAIIMDGAPMTSGANWQMLSTTRTGNDTNEAGTGGATTRGVDIRGISTDNIESVEVVTGIPGVEYGNLTSGAVIIHSKAGREPLQIRLKANPSVYEGNISQGLKLGEKSGFLNPSLNFARQSLEKNYYLSRLDAKVAYSNVFGNLSLNTILNWGYEKYVLDLNEDAALTGLAKSASDNKIGLTANGKYRFDNLWLKSIDFTLSGDMTDQYFTYGNNISGASGIYTTAMTNGAVLSSLPFGTEIRDVNGNIITNYPAADANAIVKELPQSYRSEYELFGKTINFFGKLSATLSKQVTPWFNNKILLGLDFRSSGNKGEGLKYDLEWPPARETNLSSYASIRPRKPSDIPFLNQLGLYAEENILLTVFNRDINISAGVRYDKAGSLSILAPRINASLELVPKVLTIRGGYGIQSKAPLAMHLYPDKAYFDMSNFNNIGYPFTSVYEQNQYLITSTYVYDASNPELKMATNKKRELGLDLKVGKWSLNATYFDEEMHNGYALRSDLGSHKMITFNQYGMVSFADHNLNPYALRLTSSSNFFLAYSRPTNDLSIIKHGVEFTLNSGRIDDIRTSFTLTGAYQYEENWSDGTFQRNSSGAFTSRYLQVRDGTLAAANLNRHLIILAGEPTRTAFERLITTLRAVHNIPQIGMVLSLSAQVTWLNSSWDRIMNEKHMIAQYISYKDGQLHDFTQEQYQQAIDGLAVGASRAEFSEYFANYGLQPDRIYEIPTSYKPYWMANIYITKEIRDLIRISAFANNMFLQYPLRETSRYPGRLTRMQTETSLFFGLEMTITLR